MSRHVFTVLAIVIAFGAAALVVAVAHAVIHRALDHLDAVPADSRRYLHERATRLVRVFRLLAFGAAALGSVPFALARMGITEPAWNLRTAGHWTVTHGVNLVVIVIAAVIAVRAANLLIENLQQQLSRRQATADLEWQRRASTLGGILTSFVTVTVWFVAALLVLRELSVNVLPVLTGAGIAGLAIGFGAQNLVRDFISGFFLILEDQVRVGDIARVNGVTGTIEQINLRTIALRDSEGAVQVFPNGTVTALANLSKQFAYALIEVRVPYGESVDRVFEAIREAGASMQADHDWAAVLLAPVEIVGVVSIADGNATVSARFKTQPLNQGRVANEWRRRLLETLAGRGIRPFAS